MNNEDGKKQYQESDIETKAVPAREFKDVSEELRRTQELALKKSFKFNEGLSNVSVFVINSEADITHFEQVLTSAGNLAEKEGKVTSILIKPSADLLSKAYALVEGVATAFTTLPTGIENVAEHEMGHAEAARKIADGEGKYSQFGGATNFEYALQILIYPEYTNPDESKQSEGGVTIPLTYIGLIIVHHESVSHDQRLAVNLEVVLGALDSEDKLSPSDIQQIESALLFVGEDTPLLNKMIEVCSELLPPELQEKATELLQKGGPVNRLRNDLLTLKETLNTVSTGPVRFSLTTIDYLINLYIGERANLHTIEDVFVLAEQRLQQKVEYLVKKARNQYAGIDVVLVLEQVMNVHRFAGSASSPVKINKQY